MRCSSSHFTGFDSALPQNITELLLDWNKGSPEALEKLMPMVETELRRIAANYMKRERVGHSLETTHW
jgi:hypothetical protein